MSLSVVSPPPEPASSPAVDIVGIHSLGGETPHHLDAPQIEGVLIERLPTSADSRCPFGQSTAEIVDHAKSLLACLVDKREELEVRKHGETESEEDIDGIVVKQVCWYRKSRRNWPATHKFVYALFQARPESRYQVIKDATVGLIVLVHKSSPSSTSFDGPPNELGRSSPVDYGFRFQLPDYEVYSFYERQPMKGLSGLIVKKYSALFETNHEEQIPVDADHSAMCKFETESDDTYEKVYKRIKRMKNNPRSVATEEVVELRKSKFGADHPDTLASQNLLAHLSPAPDETLSAPEASHRPKHATLNSTTTSPQEKVVIRSPVQ